MFEVQRKGTIASLCSPQVSLFMYELYKDYVEPTFSQCTFQSPKEIQNYFNSFKKMDSFQK